MTRRRTIALVYPPFGPAGLPSLGLSLLAARLRADGWCVAVDYWNLTYLAGLPLSDGASLADREAFYRELSGGALFPLNEWIFRTAAYGDDADGAAAATLLSGVPPRTARRLKALRADADRAVAEAAERLDGFDVVGLASTFHQNAAAHALARALKRRRPDIVTILGGANADGPMAAAHLALHPSLDLAVAGEADETLPRVLEALDDGGLEGLRAAAVPGVAMRGPDGAVVVGPPPRPVAHLDALPIPDSDDYVARWHETGLAEGGRLTLSLESSRGCWWGERSHCTFCGLNALGMQYRRKDFARFAREVETVMQRYGTPFLFMADNILAMDYLPRFARWAEGRGATVDFFYEIKANLRRDQVAALAAAGVTTVQPGIESFATPILRLMGKGLRGVQNVAFLRYAADEGLRPVYNILAGFPHERPEDVRAMLDLLPTLFHLPPPTSTPPVEFHRFSPYHDHPETFGLRLRPDPRYAVAFPFDEAGLASIAYRFVAEGVAPPPYLEELADLVSRWQRTHRRGAARLAATPIEDGIRITDTRGGPPRRTLLAGYAAALYDQLDRPRSVENVAEAARKVEATPSWDAARYLALSARHADAQVILLTAETVRARPRECLDLLVRTGAVMADEAPDERTLFLALATAGVPARRPPDLSRLRV